MEGKNASEKISELRNALRNHAQVNLLGCHYDSSLYKFVIQLNIQFGSIGLFMNIVDCLWEDWSECQNVDCKTDGLSPSVGIGIKHRRIKVKPINGGKPCSGDERKSCKVPCPGVEYF